MKYCQECGIKITGRIDKKFCGDTCRIHYHNVLNKQRDALLKTINRKLKKNAVILERLLKYGIESIRKELLESEGFDFVFITHQLITKDGKEIICCYNYGYYYLTAEELKLIEVKDLDSQLSISNKS